MAIKPDSLVVEFLSFGHGDKWTNWASEFCCSFKLIIAIQPWVLCTYTIKLLMEKFLLVHNIRIVIIIWENSLSIRTRETNIIRGF